jgi:hypothetical protein
MNMQKNRRGCAKWRNSMSNASAAKFRRHIDNKTHRALVSRDKVVLVNKSTADSIDFIVTSDEQRECLLDVIFNRD